MGIVYEDRQDIQGHVWGNKCRGQASIMSYLNKTKKGPCGERPEDRCRGQTSGEGVLGCVESCMCVGMWGQV